MERDSLLRNDLRPASKGFKGNELFLRFATQGKMLVCEMVRESNMKNTKNHAGPRNGLELRI